MSTLPGKFIWFEHASPDPAKARKFYEPLFGWHVEQMPMGDASYPVVLNGADGIGGLVQAEGPAAWLSYISVTDVDAVYRAALAAGAQPVSPPTDFPPMGRGASFRDPTGAAVSVWKSARDDRPDVERVPIGAWHWNELVTTDADQALAFYEKVFGYTHETMAFGESGSYQVLHASGKSRGGIFESAACAPTGPVWLPYVHVADCDATAAQVTRLGGTVSHAPTDIPGIGRFAAAVDPQGAQIAFITAA